MDVEEVIQKINHVDDEIFKIFKMVYDEKEISVYKNNLVTLKLDILEKFCFDIVIDALYNEKNKLQKYGRYRIILIIISIIGILLLFFKPFLGIAMLLLNYINYTLIKNKMDKDIVDGKSLLNLLEKMKDMKVEIQNCRTFLKAHTNYDLKSTQKDLENNDLKTINLLNNEIETELTNDDFCNDNLMDFNYEIDIEEQKSMELVRKKVNNKK